MASVQIIIQKKILKDLSRMLFDEIFIDLMARMEVYF